jgi:hypothetical protein
LALVSDVASTIVTWTAEAPAGSIPLPRALSKLGLAGPADRADGLRAEQAVAGREEAD